MADNLTVPAAGTVLAADDIGGVFWPRSKMAFGADGAATDVSAADPLPVTLGANPLLVNVGATTAAPLPVTLGAAALPVTLGTTAAAPLNVTLGTATVKVDTGATTAAPLPVIPIMTTGGNVSVQTSGGATYAVFASQACRSLLVVNDTGATILVQQGATGVGLPIRDGMSQVFLGISNTNQLGVKRKDDGAAVSVQARWEG